MNKILMCQISSTLIKTNDKLEQQFEDLFFEYARKDGYYKHTHFYELPLWVAECTYTLKDKFELEFVIITIDNFNKLPHLDRYDYILFSVLDCNKHIIKKFIEENMFCSTKTKFIMGGYTILEDDTYQGISKYTNISNVDSIETMCKLLDVKYEYGLDYSLLPTESTIPRLKLSKGCNFNCSFCSIEKGVINVNPINIKNQIINTGISSLNYKLIYLDDKTFFQYPNWNENLDIATTIIIQNQLQNYHPIFIIQTSPKYLIHNYIHNILINTNIRFIEIGLESYNDYILQKYNKPFTLKTFNKAFENVTMSCGKVILNIIIGFPEETYESYTNTFLFLKQNIDNIYSINYFYYESGNQSELGSNLRDIDIEFKNNILQLFINKFNNE